MNTLRCQVVPLPRQEVGVEIDGETRMVWHGGPWAPRPFMYPLVGPSGHGVTRMGHPGAPNHDHHRSVWFAHAKVLGINFWSDVTDARIRQKSWLVYEDGAQQARLAVRLAWYDGHDPAELLEQDVFFTVLPLEERELLIDIQTTFQPAAEQLELGITNFGFLAVRMAKHLSAHFGDGTILNSERQEGEPQIFGQPAQWVDYSGSAPDNPHVHREGISYLDHPDNFGYPSRWHVREDGWMGSSLCMKQRLVLQRSNPLRLRYGLFVHGEADPEKINSMATKFSELPVLGIRRGTRKHEQYEITETPSRV